MSVAVARHDLLDAAMLCHQGSRVDLEVGTALIMSFSFTCFIFQVSLLCCGVCQTSRLSVILSFTGKYGQVVVSVATSSL